MRTAIQKKNEKISLSLLFRLTRRSVLFLFLFLTDLLLLYIIGNYQLFLDSNQKLILNIASLVAAGLLFISTAGIIEGILCIIKKRRRRFYYIFHLILMIISAIYSLLFMIIFSATLILSSGL